MTFVKLQLKWWSAIACALAIGGGAALLSTATHADSSSDVTPVFPAAVAADEAAAAEAGFQAQFALLRGASDGIPSDAVIRDPGIERSAARAVEVASASELADAGAAQPRARIWIAPRSDGTTCLLAQPQDAQGPAELCATLDQATGGYLLMTQARAADDVELYGLVPDGVASVEVTLGDASSVTLPVRSNAYAAHFTQSTAAVAFVDAKGAAHELPAGSAG